MERGKDKKNFKNLIMMAVILIFGCFILSGCFLFNINLKAPTISINKPTKTISWKKVYDYTTYEIYINDELAETVSSDYLNSQNNTYYYDFSSKIIDNGVYYFKVRTKSQEDKYSEFSNKLAFTNGSVFSENDKSNKLNYKVQAGYGVDLIEKSDSIIEWNKNASASNYVFTVFSNSTGLKHFETKNNFFDISNITTTDLVAYRVGVQYSNSTDIYYNDETINYFNPNIFAPYTSIHYYFDDQLNDYYICSESELSNVLYYNFVLRTTNYKILLSNEFANSISNSIFEQDRTNDIKRYITDVFEESFLETASYLRGQFYICDKVEGNVYEISLGFHDITECNLNIDYSKIKVNGSPIDYTELQQIQTTLPYYERTDLNFTKRDEAFNNWASDKQFFSVEVNTSDELYWAVECGLTPICKEGSRAEIIYNLAKDVLKNIISDDMNDFEKILCIYDWICVNTTYFNLNLNYISSSSYYLTEFPCFYLEGVFIQKVAVCDGFSKAFSLLCNMEGIKAVRITGKASSNMGVTKDNHAWNKVNLGGSWYLVDTTWAELRDSRSQGTERLQHRYFLTTDSLTENSHYPLIGRTKYENYRTNSDACSYYENMVLTCNKNEYETIYEDLVISTKKEYENIVEYCILNGIDSIDLLVDVEYAKKVNNISSSTYYSASKGMDKVLSTFTSSTWFIEVNYAGDIQVSNELSGCIINIKITNLIQTTSSFLNLVNKLSDYQIQTNSTKTIYAYVSTDCFNSLYPAYKNDYAKQIELYQNQLKSDGHTNTYLTYLNDPILKYNDNQKSAYRIKIVVGSFV